MAKRGQVGWEILSPWVIGLILLGLLLIFYGILRTSGGGALDFFRNLIRFG